MDSRFVKIDGCKYFLILGLMNIKLRGSLCLLIYFGSYCFIKLIDMKSLFKMGGGGVLLVWFILYVLVDIFLVMMLLWSCMMVRVYREKVVGFFEEWIFLVLINFFLNFFKKLVILLLKYIINIEFICLKYGVNLFRILGNEVDGIKINNFL